VFGTDVHTSMIHKTKHSPPPPTSQRPMLWPCSSRIECCVRRIRLWMLSSPPYLYTLRCRSNGMFRRKSWNRKPR